MQFTASHVFWAKETLINAAERRIPPGGQFLAWIDGDLEFCNPNWVSDTVSALRKADFVQMFSEAHHLSPSRDVLARVRSFASQHCSGAAYVEREGTHPEYWHPGFAWAARRTAFVRVHGVIDRTLGSADRHMAMALIGRAAETYPATIHDNYKVCYCSLSPCVDLTSFG